MTLSETVVSELSKIYFYSDFVYDNLYFVYKEIDEKEFADILIQVSNFFIVVQIKERNSDFNSGDFSWFRNKILKKAHSQHKTSVKYIKESNVLRFENSDGNSVDITDYKEDNFKFLTVFENNNLTNFPRYNESNVIGAYNIMKIEDFENICESLISPSEVLKYLDFRIEYLKKDPYFEKLVSTITLDRETTVVANVKNEQDLVYLFLSSEYRNFETIQSTVVWFKEFTSKLKINSDSSFFQKLVSFFNKFDRLMIEQFYNKLRNIENNISRYSYIMHENTAIIMLNETEIIDATYYFLMNAFLITTGVDSLFLIAIKNNHKNDSEFSFYLLNKEETTECDDDFLNVVKRLFRL